MRSSTLQSPQPITSYRCARTCWESETQGLPAEATRIAIATGLIYAIVRGTQSDPFDVKMHTHARAPLLVVPNTRINPYGNHTVAPLWYAGQGAAHGTADKAADELSHACAHRLLATSAVSCQCPARACLHAKHYVGHTNGGGRGEGITAVRWIERRKQSSGRGVIRCALRARAVRVPCSARAMHRKFGFAVRCRIR
jgi:hypothetical protein